MEELKNWLGLIAVSISIGGIVWSWLTSGGTKALAKVGELEKATEERLDEIEKLFEAKCEAMSREHRLHAELVVQRFGMLDLQMAKFDEALKHLPDRAQAHDLAMAVEKMAGQIATMDARLSGRIEQLDERLKPVASISDRLQEFLLDQAGRK